MASIKTRNSNTFTESEFWSFIRSCLRQKSRFWKPISECRMKARRPYIGDNKRQKYEYQCSVCLKYFPDKEIQVDHTISAGSLKSGKDLEGFIERLFCEADGLTCMCKKCHLIKTKEDKLI